MSSSLAGQSPEKQEVTHEGPFLSIALNAVLMTLQIVAGALPIPRCSSRMACIRVRI
jgi:hypothetical protein